MKDMLRLLAAAAALQTVFGAGADYDAQANWATMDGGNSCGGSQQSPIRLENVPAANILAELTDDNKLDASYTATDAHVGYGKGMTVTPNTGTTLGSVTYNGNQYNAIQFHVHFPSEYAVAAGTDGTDGGLYTGELHVVHQRDGTSDLSDLLVVGKFLQVVDGAADSAFLESAGFGSFGGDALDGSETVAFGDVTFADGEAPTEDGVLDLEVTVGGETRTATEVTGSLAQVVLAHSHENMAVNVNLTDFLGVTAGGKIGGEYWRYMGSLTTPPCTESVNWFSLKDPEVISQAQADAFTGMDFGSTNRALQTVFTNSDDTPAVELYENTLTITRDQYVCPETAGFEDLGQCSNADAVAAAQPAPETTAQPAPDTTAEPTTDAPAGEGGETGSDTPTTPEGTGVSAAAEASALLAVALAAIMA